MPRAALDAVPIDTNPEYDDRLALPPPCNCVRRCRPWPSSAYLECDSGVGVARRHSDSPFFGDSSETLRKRLRSIANIIVDTHAQRASDEMYERGPKDNWKLSAKHFWWFLRWARLREPETWRVYHCRVPGQVSMGLHTPAHCSAALPPA